jgi:hypothetical protein
MARSGASLLGEIRYLLASLLGEIRYLFCSSRCFVKIK